MRDDLGELVPSEIRVALRAYATEAIAAQAAEMEALRADAALLQWILSHPETCAEELEDACASLLDPRTYLERRKAGIEAAARAALKEQAPNAKVSRSAPLLAQVGSTDGLERIFTTETEHDTD